MVRTLLCLVVVGGVAVSSLFAQGKKEKAPPKMPQIVGGVDGRLGAVRSGQGNDD